MKKLAELPVDYAYYYEDHKVVRYVKFTVLYSCTALALFLYLLQLGSVIHPRKSQKVTQKLLNPFEKEKTRYVPRAAKEVKVDKNSNNFQRGTINATKGSLGKTTTTKFSPRLENSNESSFFVLRRNIFML